MQGESDTRRCSITVKIALHRTNSSLFKQFLILRSGPHSKVYQARDPVLHRQLAPRVRLPEGNLADLGLVSVLVVGREERRLDFSTFCLIFDVNDIVGSGRLCIVFVTSMSFGQLFKPDSLLQRIHDYCMTKFVKIHSWQHSKISSFGIHGGG